MMSRWLRIFTVVGAWSVANFGFAQGQNNPNPNDQNLQGTVVRVEGQDRVIVKTNDNREVILFSEPQTQFWVDGKTGRFADIRQGARIRGSYRTVNDRQIAVVLRAGEVGDNVTDNVGNANRQFRGRVVRVNADATQPQIVAKTQDGREMTLFVQNNARILRNGATIKVSEVQVGQIIETTYIERDNHTWVEQVTVINENAGTTGQQPTQPGQQPAQPTQPADATVIQGQVVRIVGNNQVVIRTSDNKEMTIDLTPQTTYTFNEQPAQITQIQPGSEVRVQYTTSPQTRRPIASRLFGGIRNNR